MHISVQKYFLIKISRICLVINFLLAVLLLISCSRNVTDPFIPKDKKFDTQFKFSKKKNHTIEKHVSFSKHNGKFKDAFAVSYGMGNRKSNYREKFSSHKKGSYGGTDFKKSKNSFSGSGNNLLKKKNYSAAFTSGNKKQSKSYSSGSAYKKSKNKGSRFGYDSFGSKKKTESGMYRFDAKSKKVVSRKKITVFGSVKSVTGSGSYSQGKKHSKGMFTYNKKKKQVTSKHMVFSGIRSVKKKDAFGGVKNSSGSEFKFQPKKKRSGKKFMLIKKGDVKSGSFGGKILVRRNISNKHVYSKKGKSHQQSRPFMRNRYSRGNGSDKKKELQLDLFDPKLKRQMRIGH